MGLPAARSISSSASTKGRPSRGARRRPTADLPQPGMPTSTIDRLPSARAQTRCAGASSASSFLPPCPNRIITSLSAACRAAQAALRQRFCLWLAAFWRNMPCARQAGGPPALPTRAGRDIIASPLALNIPGRERVRHMPSLLRFLVVVGVLGAVVYGGLYADGGVVRARAERDIHHGAGRQDTPLAAACPPMIHPMRAGRSSLLLLSCWA